MCTIHNIRLISLVIAIIKGAICLYFFAVGCFFASSAPLLRGYGLVFSGYGAGLLLLALVSFAVVFLFFYGIKSHNRFVLLVSTGGDVLLALQIIVVGSLIKSATVPAFTKSLQSDCLRHKPISHTSTECFKYFNADRTAGFRLFWAGFYSNQRDYQQLQVIQKIQQSENCCGFFAPRRCTAINTTFPTSFSQVDVSGDLLAHRVQCGPVGGYYPVRPDCLDYSDETTVPKTVGGCSYDLGVDYCLDYTVEAYSIGCASAVEDYLAAQVGPLADTVLGLVMIHFVTAFFSCCMYVKRKEIDVYPSLATSKLSIDFAKVRDEFEIRPAPGLLVKKGFLPDPRGGGGADENEVVHGREGNGDRDSAGGGDDDIPSKTRSRNEDGSIGKKGHIREKSRSGNYRQSERKEGEDKDFDVERGNDGQNTS